MSSAAGRSGGSIGHRFGATDPPGTPSPALRPSPIDGRGRVCSRRTVVAARCCRRPRGWTRRRSLSAAAPGGSGRPRPREADARRAGDAPAAHLANADRTAGKNATASRVRSVFSCPLTGTCLLRVRGVRGRCRTSRRRDRLHGCASGARIGQASRRSASDETSVAVIPRCARSHLEVSAAVRRRRRRSPRAHE